MITVPFLSCHLDKLELQDNQSEMLEYLEAEGYGEMIEQSLYSYSVFKDGELLGCGGFFPQSNYRCLAWSLISKKTKGLDMLGLTRITKDKIRQVPYQRIESVVKGSFVEGHRWMRLLGFKCETPYGMVNWFDNGESAFLYSRSN